MKTSTRTYTLTIEKHPDGYLAYFPALAGCHTWGRTYEEAVAHAEEALAVYLETLAETRPPTSPIRIERQKGSHITLRNPETKCTTVVPMHSAELPRWLMKKIIKDA